MNATERPVIAIDFEFGEVERQSLARELNAIPYNPYRLYPEFLRTIGALVSAGHIPASFREFCKRARERSVLEHPFLFIKNCPIDEELPIFDFEQPVQSKYELKKTFIGEGFLVLFAQLMGMPAVGYKNVNGGDIVHDIYPQKALYETQSQKTLKPIGFHKDLANHFVRPDFVNILSMRSSEQNEIFTTFVRNLDVLAYLGKELEEVLRRSDYYTPYDDLSVHGDKERKLGRAELHPVVQGEADLVYFENRTVAHSPEGEAAIRKVNVALHRLKTRVLMRPGDFVSCANHSSLHGKDVGEIRDAYQQKIRWSIKTVNLVNLEAHRRHFKEYVPNSYAIVDG